MRKAVRGNYAYIHTVLNKNIKTIHTGLMDYTFFITVAPVKGNCELPQKGKLDFHFHQRTEGLWQVPNCHGQSISKPAGSSLWGVGGEDWPAWSHRRTAVSQTAEKNHAGSIRKFSEYTFQSSVLRIELQTGQSAHADIWCRDGHRMYFGKKVIWQ